ncbi:MAG: potassium/proton antiporter [Candidatus Omnitrophica bacterium]|nr:potassium/proton antiporter [Candidatus Omnitrophota bacterium]
MDSFHYLLLAATLMLLVGVLSSKISDRLGVPSLLMFILVGMLAGSEGPGGIFFENYQAVRFFGIIALSFIIFDGGLNTEWKEVKPLFLPGVSLATIGVLITAVITGCFAVWILRLSIREGFLLGAIVSSTDAASVFALLRSRRLKIENKVQNLLELESGSNDPMAVFLTIGCISLMAGEGSAWRMVPSFLREMVFGGVAGYLMGRVIVFIFNHIRLEQEGLRPVIDISLVPMTYLLAKFAGGNGFLAVYIAGIVVGNRKVVKKYVIATLHDYIAWVMQIAMFLLLGLLATPSRIAAIFWPGLLISVILMLLARPLSVFVTLLFSKTAGIREKTLVSFVGLRGAVPIILATFPFAAGIGSSDTIFNVVFFIVITSLLIQGTLIPSVSRALKLTSTMERKKRYPIELAPSDSFDAILEEIVIPYHSVAVGRPVIELDIPESSLIVVIAREDRFLIPGGRTILQGGDAILVLAKKEDIPQIQQALFKKKEGY